ncbi:hypothetical protein ACP70R_014203 [Stipagrostis hirtigluma subsp. patula]
MGAGGSYVRSENRGRRWECPLPWTARLLLLSGDGAFQETHAARKLTNISLPARGLQGVFDRSRGTGRTSCSSSTFSLFRGGGAVSHGSSTKRRRRQLANNAVYLGNVLLVVLLGLSSAERLCLSSSWWRRELTAEGRHWILMLQLVTVRRRPPQWTKAGS